MLPSPYQVSQGSVIRGFDSYLVRKLHDTPLVLFLGGETLPCTGSRRVMKSNPIVEHSSNQKAKRTDYKYLTENGFILNDIRKTSSLP